MAKVTGPLLSMGARGSIGKSIVMASWKGIKYARQHVTPANPRTTLQQANRTRFALLREVYKLAPALVVAPWAAFVQGRPLMPVNKFVGENNRLLNGETDMLLAQMSPGARGGLPPLDVVAIAHADPGKIQVTITPPAILPDGWTVHSCVAAALVDQDPTGLFNGNFVAGEDVADPYVIVLTGFEADQECVAFGWVVYEKPDGKLAYSVSLARAVSAGN